VGSGALSEKETIDESEEETKKEARNIAEV